MIIWRNLCFCYTNSINARSNIWMSLSKTFKSHSVWLLRIISSFVMLLFQDDFDRNTNNFPCTFKQNLQCWSWWFRQNKWSLSCGDTLISARAESSKICNDKLLVVSRCTSTCSCVVALWPWSRKKYSQLFWDWSDWRKQSNLKRSANKRNTISATHPSYWSQ